MKPTKTLFEKGLLLIAGSLLCSIGLSILTTPHEFYAVNGINLGKDISLMSEVRAPASLLVTAGIFVFSAPFIGTLRDRALGLAALIYLSYALGRTYSIVVDGYPSPGLVQAAGIEMVIGLAALVAMATSKRKQKRAE